MTQHLVLDMLERLSHTGDAYRRVDRYVGLLFRSDFIEIAGLSAPMQSLLLILVQSITAIVMFFKCSCQVTYCPSVKQHIAIDRNGVFMRLRFPSDYMTSLRNQLVKKFYEQELFLPCIFLIRCLVKGQAFDLRKELAFVGQSDNCLFQSWSG